MKISHRFIRLVSAVLVSSVVAACKPRAELTSSRQDAPAVLGRAPAWKLPNLAGQEVSSDEFKGKVVVVDFWATWCPPCRAEIPGYIELQQKYSKDGLVIVGISLDEGGRDVVRKFAEKNKMNYTIVLGNDEVVQAFGGFQAIPTTFLIDRAGNIVHRKTGAMERAEYEKVLQPFLK
ncbi:MAG: TlpA disulfide reductase family protein [Opitutaceae bacterium]|nr:TlpA disulfide reductase family protein [Opitutaceae bacterium]